MAATSASRPLSIPFGRIFFVSALATLGVLALLGRRDPEAPPALGALQAFRLTDQSGQSFGSQELEGKVWVANFIFTRCPTVCPRFTETMAQLQAASQGSGLELVSFSVDPAYDTPERLRAYGEVHGADFRRWHFLTGAYEALKRTVTQGLKMSMGEEGAEPAGLLHGTYFVLVDAHQTIRGYYNLNEPDAIEQILRDVRSISTAGGA